MALLAAVAATCLVNPQAGAESIVWNGSTSSDWTTATNWTAVAPVTAPPAFNTTLSNYRINVNFSSAGSLPLEYSAAQGDTIIDVATPPASGTNENRALVLGGANTGAGANGVVNITGGLLKILEDPDTGNPPVIIIGAGADANYAGTAALNVTGGTLHVNGATTGGEIAILFRGTSAANASLNISGTGTVIADVIGFGNSAASSGTGTINIGAGGTLKVRTILDRNAVTNSSVNFDGGKIISGSTNNNEELIRDDGGGVAVNILAGGGIFDTNGQNGQRIPVVMAGVGSIEKIGLGTLILEANNTYAGTTTISGGTLRIGNASANGTTGAGAIINNATLAVHRSNAYTLSNNISGTGNVDFTGAGTTTLSGTNTYTGATNITAGRVNLTGSLTSNVNVATGAAIGGEGSTTGSLTFTGTSTLHFDGASAGALSANTVNATGATVNLALTAPITGGTGIVVINAPGGITGTTGVGGNFVFSGRGSTYLNGTSTQLLLDFAPATLKWLGTDATNPTRWDVETTPNWDNATVLDKFFNGDFISFDDLATTFTVNASATVSPGGMTFNNTANIYTLTGSAIGGLGTLVKNGTNTLIITNNNTFAGGTTINAGTIQLGDGSNASGSLGTGPVVNEGAIVLNYGAAATVVNNISGAGPITINGTSAVTLTGTNSFAGTLTMSSGTLNVGNGGATGSLGTGSTINNGTINFNRTGLLSVSSAISGPGAVTKNGAGAVTLTGANTYSGATTISVGALVVGPGGALGDTTQGTTVASGASLGLTGGVSYPAGEALTLNGAGVTVDNTFFAGSLGSRGALQGVAGSNVWAGDVVINAANTRIGVQDGASLEVSGNITGAFDLIFRAGGPVAPGTVIISGAANSWGAATNPTTFVFGSTVKIGRNDAIPVGHIVSIGTGGVGVSTFDLNGFNQTLNGLTVGGGAAIDAIVTNGGAADSTLTLDTSVADRHFTGVLKDGLTNKINLVKNGTFQHAFSGDSAISGTTTINAGILQIGAAGGTGSLGTGPVVNNATLRFNRNNVFTFANAISGTGTVVQNGSSTVILGSANTYSGDTTVTSAGAILVTANSGVLGDTTAGTFAVGTGAVDATGPCVGLSGGVSYDAGESITIRGAGAPSGVFGAGTVNARGALQSVSGVNTWNGPIILSGPGARVGTQNGATLIINGVITGDFDSTFFTRIGSGGLVLVTSTGHNYSHTDTYGDNDNTGILRIGVNDALCTTATLKVGAGIVDLNGFNQTVAALANGTFLSTGGAAASSLTNMAGLGTTSILTVNTAAASTMDVPILDGATGGKIALVMAGFGTQTLGGASTYSGTTSVNAGTLRVTGSIPNTDITVALGATFDAAKTQTVKSLTVQSSGSAIVTGTDTVLKANVLTLDGAADAWTGRVDVRTNDLIVQSATPATVLNQVKQGYNFSGWNATGGITTSNATTVIGLAAYRNSEDGLTPLMATFGGVAVDQDSVLVKYTYNGDANLDGVIDIDDYFMIDTNYARGTVNPTYRQGDFNYSGAITADDYFMIDAAYVGQTGPLSGVASPVAAVPEPATLSLLALGAAALLRRRR